MSHQFYFYLLPQDVTSLVQTLKSRFEISLIQPSAPGPSPIELESPFSKDARMLKGDSTLVDCLITRKNAEIKMGYVQIHSHWRFQDESEVIEFHGCEFDGTVLVRGRFYFQNDFLFQGVIAPKRQEFLDWAAKVFRVAKKSLHRSKTLDAYVGQEAEKWRQKGGRFAWMVTHRGPLFEDESGSHGRS